NRAGDADGPGRGAEYRAGGAHEMRPVELTVVLVVGRPRQLRGRLAGEVDEALPVARLLPLDRRSRPAVRLGGELRPRAARQTPARGLLRDRRNRVHGQDGGPRVRRAADPVAEASAVA